MEVRGSERLLSSNENNPSRREERVFVLTGRNVSSVVVDRLCDQARGQNTAVACFYFDFAARKEQPATSMLGSLLKQVVGGMETIPEEISEAFQDQKKVIGGRGLQLPDIVKMLQSITSSLRTFVCIDALDECVATHRVKLLNSLKQVLEKSPHTRIFITGRLHIRAEIEKRLAGRVTSVSLGPSKDDIVEYLRARLEDDLTPDAMEESLEAEILEKIPENMSDMYVGNNTGNPAPILSANRYASRFLLASLNIDAILHESTISRRREKLNKMTNGLELGDVYDATIERIKAQDGDKSRLGMTALMWISHAERPLQADELCYALAVQLGSTDFDVGNIPSISTSVNCCQGLITVDKEASTVRLIHFTLQEYFCAHPDLFSAPHSAMAEICLTYLNSKQVKTLSTTPSPNTRSAPFLEYCSVYWGVHARRELSDCGKSLALELLKEGYSLISTELLLAHADLYNKRYDTCPPFNGLQCASFFGIVKVVATLIEEGGSDINGEGYLGCTPLSWAAYNGHEEVVKILLGREEVNPDKPDNSGKTPLSYAAQSGHERVVKILLEREEVNPDKLNYSGETALSYAARNGHEGVVKILLGREEVNPDNPYNSGKTPLSDAAQSGHEGVVKILLEREEVDPDKPNDWGWTPLSYAAQTGHEGVVKILLERGGVNPDKRNYWGETPLSYATRKGHTRIVALLQSRKAATPSII